MGLTLLEVLKAAFAEALRTVLWDAVSGAAEHTAGCRLLPQGNVTGPNWKVHVRMDLL